MQIGICLLSKDGYYLRDDGTLPVRPSWDKKFLVDLVAGLECTCSDNTFEKLPTSIKENAYVYVEEFDVSINLGIKTFEYMPELMFIVRSKYEAGGGKLLRLDDYVQLITFEKEDGGFEIWKLNNMKH
jgi:hypothetical protein